MFIAALFTIARLCLQPICPSTDGWVKKMWYFYTASISNLMIIPCSMLFTLDIVALFLEDHLGLLFACPIIFLIVGNMECSYNNFT
jgi:hypothetical protein